MPWVVHSHSRGWYNHPRMAKCAQYRRLRWVDLKEAAAQAEVHPETLRKWAQDKRIKARQLASSNGEDGPWRVWLDEDGLPADPKVKVGSED
jgi:hypothetical protein